MTSTMLTHFATVERTDKQNLNRQKAIFQNLPQLSFFLDAVPNDYLVLNENRQIVFANKQALQNLGFSNIDSILGMRQGEALKCTHAREMEAGCGTSEACKVCGAAKATLNGLSNKVDVQECRIMTEENQFSYDFRVCSNPYNFDGEKFAIISLVDISNEKRKAVLERIFFHDVLNTAGGIKGISEIILDHPEEIDEYKSILNDSSNRLVAEIVNQRDLLNAENNDISIQILKVNSIKTIDYLANLYLGHKISTHKKIIVCNDCDNIDFDTDESLLLRVLGNMTKNALESSDEGQFVTIDCKLLKEKVLFSVNNSKFMPRDIQLQVFQRSFSTKGEGRGIGTYSMKLLSEKYLNGKVYFTSDQDKGTTFFAEFPLIFP